MMVAGCVDGEIGCLASVCLLQGRCGYSNELDCNFIHY